MMFSVIAETLKPGGVLIPDRAVMKAAPIEAADYYAKHISAWADARDPDHASHTQGIDYSAIEAYAKNSLFYDTAADIGGRLLGPAAELLDLDFNAATNADCNTTGTSTIDAPGHCHGWLGWFDMRLGGQWLSTGPDAATTHWGPVLLPLSPPVAAAPGDTLTLGLQRADYGEWTWTCSGQPEEQAVTQRHSTFNSEPLTPTALARRADSHAPELSTTGEAALFALTCFQGSTPSADISERLRERFPGQFPTAQSARHFVQKLVDRFG